MKRSARELSAFRRSAPGTRFQERYWRFRHAVVRRSLMWRLTVLIAGGLLAAIGVVLLFIPGPGLLFLAAGGAMAATQSLLIARVFDRGEVAFRVLARRARAWWSDHRRR